MTLPLRAVPAAHLATPACDAYLVDPSPLPLRLCPTCLPLLPPQAVRDDPLAYNETGDEYARAPGQRPWVSEMYGYSFGAAASGVWHRVDHAAM